MINKEFILVIPCYNEEFRFNVEYFEQLLKAEDLALLLVDDGSTDRTGEVLRAFVEKNPYVSQALFLSRNIGKANAVRTGMLRASELKSTYVGYLDADGAFPIEVVLKSLEQVRESSVSKTSYWFSRVKLASSDIERNWKRHYIGRVIITLATMGLTNCPYDTQAGFKIFRTNSITREIWGKTFKTQWLFDIELFLRLSERDQARNLVEIPINAWRDVKGSKINLRSSFRILLDLILIRRMRKRFQIRNG